MKLKIRKMGINGEGIGYVDHKPVFVEGVLPYEESVQTMNTILKKDVLYIFFNTRHSSNIKNRSWKKLY